MYAPRVLLQCQPGLVLLRATSYLPCLSPRDGKDGAVMSQDKSAQA